MESFKNACADSSKECAKKLKKRKNGEKAKFTLLSKEELESRRIPGYAFVI